MHKGVKIFCSPDLKTNTVMSGNGMENMARLALQSYTALEDGMAQLTYDKNGRRYIFIIEVVSGEGYKILSVTGSVLPPELAEADPLDLLRFFEEDEKDAPAKTI